MKKSEIRIIYYSLILIITIINDLLFGNIDGGEIYVLMVLLEFILIGKVLTYGMVYDNFDD